MSEQSTVVDINAPQQRVWDVLSDVAGWPRWMPEAKKVTTEATEPAVGAEYTFDQGWWSLGLPLTGRITRLEAPSLLEMEQTQTGMRTVATYTLTDRGDGWTRLESSLTSTGAITGAVGAVMGSGYTTMLRDAADRLKALCEGQHARA